MIASDFVTICVNIITGAGTTRQRSIEGRKWVANLIGKAVNNVHNNMHACNIYRALGLHFNRKQPEFVELDA